MAQFELNLDPFIQLGGIAGNSGFSLPGVVNIAQLSGVNGFCLTYDGVSNGITEQLVEQLARLAPKIRFNLKIAPKPDLVQAVIDLPVQQATFIGEGLFDNYKKDLGTFVAKLKGHKRLASVHIPPDVNALRQAYKIEADYVDLDVSGYGDSTYAPNQASQRENLAVLAKTAVKNQLGVAVSGNLHYQNVQPLISIEEIENFIVGEGVLSRAVFVGLETAIRDMRNLLL